MADLTPAALLAAYRNAVYSVHADGREVQFRVNERCPQLDEVLAALGAQSAAFITAANPRSQPFSDTENAQRNAQLASDLAHAGFHYLLGEGRDPTGQWPPEQSLLVVNIERAAASVLARQHGQYGWVLLRPGQPPELVLEPPDPSAD
jgi:hypothetical protein